tara:strand:+ start:367 stop:552 length:186 start_codon:yes stop_codon:yes gene_type:complete
MKLSKKKTDELYNCIYGNIFNKRLELVKGDQLSKSEVDDVLYDLEKSIWESVKQVFKVQEY